MSSGHGGSPKAKKSLRFRLIAWGLAFIALAVAIGGVVFLVDYFKDKTVSVQHVVVSTRSVPLSHFVDRNTDGIIQEAERRVRRVPNGCYTFTATGPDTMFDHLNQVTAVGDLVRLNGYDQRGGAFPVADDGNVTVSFDPSFGTGQIAGGGYEVVNITLTPASCPDEG
jgi:hypothetical protein